MAQRRLISIITPVYNEQENVADCYAAVKQVFDKQLPQYDYEHIFCDNASLDNTAALLRGLAAKDKHVKVILNSRNFGASRSGFNGLMSAQGDAVVFTIAADLQDPPAIIPEFVKKWEEGYKVVYGIRAQRAEKFLIKNLRKIYYRVLGKLSEVEIPKDVGDFQLLDKVVLNSLRQFDDYYPYTRGLIAQCGFDAIGLNYSHLRRDKGKAKGNLLVMMDLGLNGLVSVSNAPLRLCMLFGVIIAFLSFSYAVIQFFFNLVFYQKFASPGIATIVIALFFFSGVQLLFLGLIGEYISAIHFQVRKRPLVIEKERINFD